MINRSLGLESFLTREENNEKYIEGYFSVFNSPYNIAKDATETVAPGAFKNTLDDDIRALINHDSGLVLGRNKAGTLELREDDHGLFGRILINPNDQDAVNLYERVKRGDVSQCSFGFDILDEETELREDGSVHWTIKAVKLYEVSVVTFPAYEETSVSARSAEADKMREAQAWRLRMLEKLKGEADGTQSN